MDPARLRLVVDCEAWNPGEEETRFLLSLLPDDEQQRCRAYRRAEDQKHALASKLLQRHAVGQALGTAFEQVQLKKTRGGKPFAANSRPPQAPQNWNYSVSHEVGCRETSDCSAWRGQSILMRGWVGGGRSPSSGPPPPDPALAGGPGEQALAPMPRVPRPTPCERIQGSYVVLCSEAPAIVGCDLSAPRSKRPGTPQPMASFLKSFKGQLSKEEVCSCSFPAGPLGRRLTCCMSVPACRHRVLSQGGRNACMPTLPGRTRGGGCPIVQSSCTPGHSGRAWKHWRAPARQLKKLGFSSCGV